MLVVLAAVVGSFADPGVAAAEMELDHGGNVLYELCNGTTFPGITNGTVNDPWAGFYGSQYLQARTAIADSLWMHLREGVWTKTIVMSSSCRTFRSDWFDGSEEEFESWYHTFAKVSGDCGGAAVGCAGWDFLFPGVYWILAADTEVTTNGTGATSWGVINQDTVADYLETTQACMSFENTWLHETGHAYGLEHTNAQINNMGTGSFCNKNINITQANNDFQWPINVAELESHYEIAGGGTRANYSASIYRRPAGQGDGMDAPNQPGVTSFTLSTSNPTANVSIQYSLERFFSASQYTVGVQFRWVPSGSIPPFNWSTRTFSWPAGTSTDIWDIDVFSGPAQNAQFRQTTFATSRTSIPWVGVPYTLWILVDYSYVRAETDEGDNMIPTQYTLTRTN